MTTTAPESLGAVLLDMLFEAVRCKHRIAIEQDSIDELRKLAANEYGCSPKDFNQYVRTSCDATRSHPKAKRARE